MENLERLNDLIDEGFTIDFAVDGLVTTIKRIERRDEEYLVVSIHPRRGQEEVASLPFICTAALISQSPQEDAGYTCKLSHLPHHISLLYLSPE